MAALALDMVALESDSTGERGHGIARLLALHHAEPWTKGLQHALECGKTFGDPLEGVGLAVRFYSAHPHDAAESKKDWSRRFDRSESGCRRSDPVPRRSADTLLWTDEAEAALAVEEASGPRPVQSSACLETESRTLHPRNDHPRAPPMWSSADPPGRVLLIDDGDGSRRLLSLDDSNPLPFMATKNRHSTSGAVAPPFCGTTTLRRQ